MEKVVSEVLLKGDFQLSTAERKKKTEEKRAQIIAFIAKNYMEPKTYLPIPRTRIENGIESIKGLKIDPFRSEKTQAEELVKRLKDLFPLVKNEVFGKLSIPLHLAASISGSLRASNACSILKEQWGEEAIREPRTLPPSQRERLEMARRAAAEPYTEPPPPATVRRNASAAWKRLVAV